MDLKCSRCSRRATHIRRGTKSAAIYYPWCFGHAPVGATKIPDVGRAMLRALYEIHDRPGVSTLDLLGSLGSGRMFGATIGPVKRLEAIGAIQRWPDGRRVLNRTTNFGEILLAWSGYRAPFER